MACESTRILVIEDEAAHAEAVRRSLEAMPGTELRFGTSLLDFRTQALSWHPDIALVDLNLADGMALEILPDPSETRPFPIIVMTSNGNEQIAVEAMKSGATDYLVKSPGTFAGLAQTVRRMLREWSYRIESRRLHQELKEKEEGYRRQFSGNFAVMLLIDPGDGRILDANDAASRFYGYPRERLLAMAIPEITAPSGEDLRPAMNAPAQDHGMRLESRHRLADGAWRDVEIFLSQMLIGGRRILHAIVHDITDRKRSEEALRKERNFTRALLDNLVEGVVACDDRGDLALFNRTLANWQGMDALDLPQEQWAEHYDLFEADGATPLATQAIPLVRAFNGEEVRDVGLVIAARNQPPRHVLCNGSPILDETGQRLGAVVVMHDVTRQRQDSENLKDMLDRLKLATTSAKLGVWDWDLQAGTMIWDDRMLELFGVARGEIHGTVQDWKDGLHPEDRDRAVAECEAALRGEAPFNTEYRLKPRSGAGPVIKAVGLIIRDERGNPVRMIGINQDITEIKQAVEQLQERERLLELFIQNAPAAIAMLDLDMRYICASLRWNQDYRIETQSLIGRSHYEIFPEIPERWKEIHRRCLAGATESCEEDPFPRQDGTMDWVKWSIRPWFNASREIGGIIIMSEMVTERKFAEDALRKISVAIEQSPVTVLITNPGGRIEYVNPKFTEVTGYTATEAMGRNPRFLKAGSFPAEHYRQLWETITGGDTWKGEFHNKRKNGEPFWESATIAPIKDSTGRVINFVAIKEDVTEYKRLEAGRREAEAEIRQLNERLEQRVKERTAQLEAANKEMEAFSYSVSHDLRAPLRSIDGFSQVLLEECLDQVDEAGRHYLLRSRSGTQRMGHLIDDLLKLSKTSRGELKVADCDLSGLCVRVAGDLADLAPERRVEVAIQPGMSVQADQRLLRVLLENLLGNAWKFTSKHAAPRIEVGQTIAPDGTMAFYVRDNGAGFDMAFANKLFIAFERLHTTGDFEGSGIGLTIVQRIIQRHGGTIWAEAKPEEGATFFFTLQGGPPCAGKT